MLGPREARKTIQKSLQQNGEKQQEKRIGERTGGKREEQNLSWVSTCVLNRSFELHHIAEESADTAITKSMLTAICKLIFQVTGKTWKSGYVFQVQKTKSFWRQEAQNLDKRNTHQPAIHIHIWHPSAKLWHSLPALQVRITISSQLYAPSQRCPTHSPQAEPTALEKFTQPSRCSVYRTRVLSWSCTGL